MTKSQLGLFQLKEQRKLTVVMTESLTEFCSEERHLKQLLTDTGSARSRTAGRREGGRGGRYLLRRRRRSLLGRAGQE